jgi:RNA polymerase sigma factor (sigma-70 family)
MASGRVADVTFVVLVERARADSPEAAKAWDQLVDQYARLVWKVIRCFSFSEEAAWEAYQSTWLRAIERIGTLQDPTRFPGWLASIARNEALAVIRSTKKQVLAARVPEVEADDPPVGERVDRDAVRRAVRDGFGCLSAQCQGLLRLLAIDPALPYQEIERLLDMPHGSIGPTRRRCLDKLRMTAAVMALTDEGTAIP